MAFPKASALRFLVQSAGWKIGTVSISILRRQFDNTYVAVAFDNNGHAVTLNFILVNGPDGWVITAVESQHDSLRMFLAQHRN
jgi:ribulose bisphosphate carboxylase small subunit